MPMPMDLWTQYNMLYLYIIDYLNQQVIKTAKSMSVIILFCRKMIVGEKRQSDGAGPSSEDNKKAKKDCSAAWKLDTNQW